jgi:hypothetical protein
MSSVPFPLTPAHSRRERENRRQPVDESSGVGTLENEGRKQNFDKHAAV